MSEEKKDLALSTDDQEGLDFIKKLTGEFSTPVGNEYISFNGNEGKFYQGSGDNKVEIGSEINGTIIKKTVKVETAYKSKICKTPVKSNEVLSTMGGIDLYDKDGNIVDSGDYKELKDKYDLIFTQILYISCDEFNGDLVKLTIKGSSLTQLWSYYKTTGKEATMIMWKTKFSAEEFTSDLGDKFYKIKFEKTGDVENSQLMLDHLSKLTSPEDLNNNEPF